MDKEVAPAVLAVINEKRLAGDKRTPVDIITRLGVVDARDKASDSAWLATGDLVIATIWAEFINVGSRRPMVLPGIAGHAAPPERRRAHGPASPARDRTHRLAQAHAERGPGLSHGAADQPRGHCRPGERQGRQGLGARAGRAGVARGRMERGRQVRRPGARRARLAAERRRAGRGARTWRPAAAPPCVAHRRARRARCRPPPSSTWCAISPAMATRPRTWRAAAGLRHRGVRQEGQDAAEAGGQGRGRWRHRLSAQRGESAPAPSRATRGAWRW